MTDAPACYRVANLARRWDCSPGKIRAMIADGRLPCLRLGTMIRIPAAAVEALETEWTTRPASAASPGATPGTATTAAVASLRAARIARRLKPSSPDTAAS